MGEWGIEKEEVVVEGCPIVQLHCEIDDKVEGKKEGGMVSKFLLEDNGGEH